MDIQTEESQLVKTVLVVDDDQNWCFIANKLLKKAGVVNKVLTAGNGLDAFAKLRTMAANGEKLPDLILLDIMMPVMDGFGFLDEVAKAPEIDLGQTRIYMCTSSFLAKDKERAALFPVAGFITKPLTQETLNDILKQQP